jgi:hypothetical protein
VKKTVVFTHEGRFYGAPCYVAFDEGDMPIVAGKNTVADLWIEWAAPLIQGLQSYFAGLRGQCDDEYHAWCIAVRPLATPVTQTLDWPDE